MARSGTKAASGRWSGRGRAMRSLVVPLIAVGVSACGSEGGSTELTTGQFVEQTNAVCERMLERAEAVSRPRTAIEGVNLFLPFMDEWIAQLREIKPPDRLDGTFDQYIGFLRKERDQAASARKDEATAQRYLDRDTPDVKKADAIAHELGLSDCAGLL